MWGVIGSSRKWPEVINLWEEDGYDGLARSFRHETGHPGHQDPKLFKWWNEAAQYRTGGVTRRLEPAPWTRTRFLLVDSPLCPFRTGRQPRHEDRTDGWTE